MKGWPPHDGQTLTLCTLIMGLIGRTAHQIGQGATLVSLRRTRAPAHFECAGQRSKVHQWFAKRCMFPCSSVIVEGRERGNHCTLLDLFVFLSKYLLEDLDDRLHLLHGVVVHERYAHDAIVEVELGLHVLHERERVEMAIADTDLRGNGA